MTRTIIALGFAMLGGLWSISARSQPSAPPQDLAPASPTPPVPLPVTRGSSQVGKTIGSAFEASVASQTGSTTAIPGTFNTTRPSSRCSTASGGSARACREQDAILTAHENRRLDGNDTQPIPARQDAISNKSRMPLLIYGQCGTEGWQDDLQRREGSCWAPIK